MEIRRVVGRQQRAETIAIATTQQEEYTTWNIQIVSGLHGLCPWLLWPTLPCLWWSCLSIIVPRIIMGFKGIVSPGFLGGSLFSHSGKTPSLAPLPQRKKPLLYFFLLDCNDIYILLFVKINSCVLCWFDNLGLICVVRLMIGFQVLLFWEMVFSYSFYLTLTCSFCLVVVVCVYAHELA